MLRNFFIINIVLIFVSGAVGYEFYKAVAYSPDIPSVDIKKEKKTGKENDKADSTNKGFDRTSFRVISELDLFRPTRSAPEFVNEKKDIPSGDMPKELPKLFGTIILGDDKKAIMEDPDTRKSRVYFINNSIAGYELKDIYEDRVKLERDGRDFVVKLRDDKGIQSTRKVRVKQQIKRPTPKRKPRSQPRRLPRSSRLQSNGGKAVQPGNSR